MRFGNVEEKGTNRKSWFEEENVSLCLLARVVTKRELGDVDLGEVVVKDIRAAAATAVVG